MESIMFSSPESIFKIFGLGFMAGGLFSFAVTLITDWIAEREERKAKRTPNVPKQHHI